MLSYFLDGPRHVRRVDIPIPEPGTNQVRIKVAYVGVCASDIAVYLGLRRPESGSQGIMRLGHEMSGVIDKIGERVTGLRVGDRVVCIGVWGCFSEYVLSEPIGVLKLHRDIPLIDGSIVEVLPSVAMAALRTGIDESDDVLVYGQGLTGLLLTRLLYLKGCKNLIVADKFQEKLQIAEEFGANFVIDTSRQDIDLEVKRISRTGVDYTIIATRDGSDVIKAVKWTRQRGKIVNFGGISPCDGFDYYDLHKKGLSVIKESISTPGLLEHRMLWRETMELVADGVLPTPLLRTHIFPMTDLGTALAKREVPSPDVIHVIMENSWAEQKRQNEEWF